MNNGPLLQLINLEKDYGTPANPVVVLRDVNLAVNEGEYVSIVGPSGAGKSTMLNILGLLDRPTAGEYRFHGQDVSRLDDQELTRLRRVNLGFVFQASELIGQLSVLENVELPLFYARQTRAKRRRHCRKLIEQVGLGHRIGHLPSQLSGGERQRAAIARALANDPAVILADEPTGNLDSVTSREIMRLLDELHAAGRTILLITHDPTVAERGDRRVTIRDGRIEEDTRTETPTHVSA